MIAHALAAFAVCLAVSCHSLHTSWPRFSKQIWDRSVHIQVGCFDDKDKRWSGSGFIVKPETVITAHHVIDSTRGQCRSPAMAFLQVDTADKGAFFGYVLWADNHLDMAQVIVPGLAPGIPTVKTALATRDQVVCMYNAYPKRRRQCGRISKTIPGYGYCSMEELPNCYDVDSDLDTIGGNSGSGVFDADGNLVALVVRKRGGLTRLVRDGFELKIAGKLK